MSSNRQADSSTPSCEQIMARYPKIIAALGTTETVPMEEEEKRVREMTALGRLGAFLGGKKETPHDGWLGIIAAVVVAFVIGYLCASLF